MVNFIFELSGLITKNVLRFVGTKPSTVENLEMVLDRVQGDDVGYALIVKPDFFLHREGC